jgi:hypothetical protein
MTSNSGLVVPPPDFFGGSVGGAGGPTVPGAGNPKAALSITRSQSPAPGGVKLTVALVEDSPIN